MKLPTVDMEGARIQFSASGVNYLGHVEGKRIVGVAQQSTGTVDWSAVAVE